MPSGCCSHSAPVPAGFPSLWDRSPPKSPHTNAAWHPDWSTQAVRQDNSCSHRWFKDSRTRRPARSRLDGYILRLGRNRPADSARLMVACRRQQRRQQRRPHPTHPSHTRTKPRRSSQNRLQNPKLHPAAPELFRLRLPHRLSRNPPTHGSRPVRTARHRRLDIHHHHRTGKHRRLRVLRLMHRTLQRKTHPVRTLRLTRRHGADLHLLTQNRPQLLHFRRRTRIQSPRPPPLPANSSARATSPPCSDW